MSRIDEVIADVEYVLDSLMALRDIYETGCCNNCKNVKVCKYLPKAGQTVRYNCPFYRRREE